jgi:hypothetical protein
MIAANHAALALAHHGHDAEAFLAWMRKTNEYIVHIELIDAERWAMIERLMFHYTIKWGCVGDYVTGYEDRWCVADLPRAVESFLEWKGRGFDGEPTLWRRHPNSGRRRNDEGDPASEEVAF